MLKNDTKTDIIKNEIQYPLYSELELKTLVEKAQINNAETDEKRKKKMQPTIQSFG